MYAILWHVGKTNHPTCHKILLCGWTIHTIDCRLAGETRRIWLGSYDLAVSLRLPSPTTNINSYVTLHSDIHMLAPLLAHSLTHSLSLTHCHSLSLTKLSPLFFLSNAQWFCLSAVWEIIYFWSTCLKATVPCMFYAKFNSLRPNFHSPSSKCTLIGVQAGISFPTWSITEKYFGSLWSRRTWYFGWTLVPQNHMSVMLYQTNSFGCSVALLANHLKQLKRKAGCSPQLERDN